MYILKNAMRNIFRSFGRNILIGIIVLTIAATSCIAISIRKFANETAEAGKNELTISASLSSNRTFIQRVIQGVAKTKETNGEEFLTADKAAMNDALADVSFEMLQSYSTESCVKDFYYVCEAAVSGDRDKNFEPYTATFTDTDQENADGSDSEKKSDENDDSAEEQSEPTEPTMDSNMSTEEIISQLQEQNDILKGQIDELKGYAEKYTKPDKTVSDVTEYLRNIDLDVVQKAMKNINPDEVTGDFMISGYSSRTAMTDFDNGTAEVTDGDFFEEGTSEYKCMISDLLADYNDLEVGNMITIRNPSTVINKYGDTTDYSVYDQTFELEIVGIYSTTSEESTGTSTASDPANNILMSYEAVRKICDECGNYTPSDDLADEDKKDSYAVTSKYRGTYLFANYENYDELKNIISSYQNFGDYASLVAPLVTDAFTEKNGSQYQLTSTDVEAFNSSMQPLENLKTYATMFLFVILIIGAIVLIILHIFNIRERKYEIGVLLSMGMNKFKVGMQFITEIFVVTISCILVGTAVGAATSVPVSNWLLEQQTQSAQSRQQGPGQGGDGQQQLQQQPSPDGGAETDDSSDTEAAETKITFTNSVDGIVVLIMVGIGIGLTLISSLIAVVFVMRFEPLKILTNRD